MNTAQLLPVLLLGMAAPLAAQGGDSGTVVATPSIDRLEIGGQLRARYETRDPLPPTTTGTSRSTTGGRVRVHFDATVNEHVQAFVQIQQTVLNQANASTTYLRQAWGRVTGLFEGWADVQVGRMELQYGNQRMISPLDWSFVARAWDGVRVTVGGGDDLPWQLDGFWTQVVNGQGARHGNNDFGGLYLTWDSDVVGVDAYIFKRRDGVTSSANPIFPDLGGAVAVDDYTLGALVDGAIEGFQWNVEVAAQSGDHVVGGTVLDAGGTALAAGLDYAFDDGLRIGVGYELASGDNNPADGNDDTFRRLFNFDHYWQGFQDIVVWQNLEDIVLRASYPVTEEWTLTGDVHILSLAEENGFLFTGGGGAGVVQAPGSSDIGTEVDLTIKGELFDSVQVWTGVSQFFAGDAIASNDDQTWAFLMLTLPF